MSFATLLSPRPNPVMESLLHRRLAEMRHVIADGMQERIASAGSAAEASVVGRLPPDESCIEYGRRRDRSLNSSLWHAVGSVVFLLVSVQVLRQLPPPDASAFFAVGMALSSVVLYAAFRTYAGLQDARAFSDLRDLAMLPRDAGGMLAISDDMLHVGVHGQGGLDHANVPMKSIRSIEIVKEDGFARIDVIDTAGRTIAKLLDVDLKEAWGLKNAFDGRVAKG